MAAKDFELILRVQADLQQAVSQLRTLNDQMRVTKSAAVEASGGLAGIRTSAQSAETGIRGVGTQATALNEKLGLINRTAHDLRNAFIFAFAIHEVVDFTKNLVDANTEAQRIQFTMQQAFGADGAGAQLQYVRDLSQKLGLDFKTAAEGFAQLGASAQGTGIQTSDLRKLFTGLSEAATVLHSSTEDVNGVMIQLAQAMSLGKLQMQDIRAISQHLPGTMTALGEAAKRMGTNLTDALKSGGLEARQFIGALGDVLQERFGEQAKAASHSLNSELNRLRSTLFELQTDGTGFADTFAEAIAKLNITLSDPAIRQGLKDLITEFGQLASKVVTASAELGKFLKYAAAVSSGASSKDLGGLLVEQSDIQSELQQRAQHPVLSRINSFLAGTENNPLQNTLEGGRPRIQSMSTAELNARLAEIQAQVNALEHPVTTGNPQAGDDRGLFVGENPAAPAKPDKAALRRAAELAKQAANAQKALTQSLIDMQAQLDPTAAIYAKYNAAVEKATADAELAKKAKGADAQAIDAQRDAVIALAGTVRDAALDQLAEKDRQAWEALRRSFETPAQVRVEDALKQIQQLNDLMKRGVITAQQYHDALGQIGQKAVTGALPQYQGLDAAVGGQFSELQKNYAAQTALDAAYQAQKLALDRQFNDAEEAQHAAHMAALTQLDANYAEQNGRIQQARGQLQLNAASTLFGQLATLSTSHNKKMATIGKAAAIAQTIINTYQSATEAYKAMAGIPYIGPALGAAAAAAAIVAGLANVAQIRSQSTGGYSEGGYTGDAPITQAVGVVHGREGVLSAPEVEKIGGEAGFNRLRQAIRGYASGGYVAPAHPLANAPSPAALGFAAPSALPVGSIAGLATNDGNGGARHAVGVRIINSVDRQFVTDQMNSSEGETVILNTIARNQARIKQMVR